jgi:predicted nucleic acid-binding protein
MEVRSVLTKKKRVELADVERIVDGIAARTDVYATERDDVLNAYRLQQETLLYPVDCLLLSLADGLDARLVTFDAELQEAGAVDPDGL